MGECASNEDKTPYIIRAFNWYLYAFEVCLSFRRLTNPEVGEVRKGLVLFDLSLGEYFSLLYIYTCLGWCHKTLPTYNFENGGIAF
jgi:hypothetical protein